MTVRGGLCDKAVVPNASCSELYDGVLSDLQTCRTERQAQQNSKRLSEFAVRSVAQGSRTQCTGSTVRWSLANAAKGA